MYLSLISLKIKKERRQYSNTVSADKTPQGREEAFDFRHSHMQGRDLVMKTINSHRRLDFEQREFLLSLANGRVLKKSLFLRMSLLFEKEFGIRISLGAIRRLLREHRRDGNGKVKGIKVKRSIYRVRRNRVSCVH